MPASDGFWKYFARLADALGVLGIQGLAAMVGSFTLFAWAASATAWLNAYGPIAWVGSGVVGILLLIGCLMLWARYRMFAATADVVAKQAESDDVVNPLHDSFDRHRVRLSQIASPIDNLVDGKTFNRCEILGPANVVILDGIVMQDNELYGCDFAVVRIGAHVSNAVKLRRCTINRSKLHGITFLIPPDAAHNPGMAGANWITERPAPS